MQSRHIERICFCQDNDEVYQLTDAVYLTDQGTSDDLGWDHENHLTSTTFNSVNATYDYNGDGLRMSRTIGGTTVDYVWDLARDLPAILEDSDGVRYVYGLDQLARIDSSTEEYYLPDGLGSTTPQAVFEPNAGSGGYLPVAKEGKSFPSVSSPCHSTRLPRLW